VCRDPPPVIVRADNVSLPTGDEAQLTCVVQSSVEFNVTWLRVVKGQANTDHSPRITVHDGTAIIRLLTTQCGVPQSHLFTLTFACLKT